MLSGGSSDVAGFVKNAGSFWIKPLNKDLTMGEETKWSCGQCGAHLGITKDIDYMKDDIKSLWRKWDGLQKCILTAYGALVLNLIGVIVTIALLLIRSPVKHP